MKLKVLVGIVAAALASPAITFAEDSVTAETVEVKGILPSNLEAVPGSFAIVDEKALEERQPFSMQEALNSVPGVNVVGENSFGLGVNIGVRGMDPRRTARTLLLEDGMPLFLAPYGDPAAHYTTPLELLERIEVVKGSGQVLYGPQTVGGMINFVTKPVPTNGFAGSVTAKAGNNDYYGGHVNIGYGDERGGIMIDALQNKGDGIRDNHDFDQRDITIKGQLNLSDRHTLIAKVGYYEEDSHVSETGLSEREYAEDKYQAPTGKNDKFEQERKMAQIQHIFQIDERMKLSTQAYYVDTERKSFRQINGPGGFDDEAPEETTPYSRIDRCDNFGGAGANNGLVPLTEADSAACGGRWRPREYTYWGIEPRLDFSHNLFGIENDAVIGFRYHTEDIDRKQIRGADTRFQSYSFAKGQPSREHIKTDVDAYSYYVQNTFHVGNWALTPGVRVEDYKIKTDIVRAETEPQNNPESKKTNNQTEVLPGLGVAWNGIDNTTIFAGVHKGFAPPRPDRDLQVGACADCAIVDKTKAEESTNWELGVRSNYFKGIAFESTLFHTDFDDIVIKSVAGSFENGGKSQMSGIEFAGRVDFGTIYNTSHNFYISGSYTNLFTAKFKKDGEDVESGIYSGDRLPYAPRHLASINFGYENASGLHARIGWDHVSRQKADAFTRAIDAEEALQYSGLVGDIPSYTLLNASASYKPQGTNATIFISGSNLADKEYLASRVDGMVAGRGRQVFGGVSYDF
ncbi:MAG: TonB-dependent receptor [Betaproteobacteria bacterium HGW-Betaproteobacteria-8]|nr:MAG: TonB-dependent receptor [Betaproteobacteria bacterium HGW-Betaproteobacteria-8]